MEDVDTKNIDFSQSLHLTHLEQQRASIVVNGKVLSKCGKHVKLDAILLDTGAIGASFVSKKFIEDHPHLVEERIDTDNVQVKLADGKTTCATREKVLLLVQITKNIDTVTKHVWCNVIETNMQLIIGLYDIQDNFLELFIKSIREGAKARTQDISVSYISGELVEPWSNMDQIAPELQELEDPVNFPDFHRHMTMSSIEIEDQYERDIQAHVNDEMIRSTNILQLLRGKGKKVFIHDGLWEGIRGIEAMTNMSHGLELTWKEELVANLKRSKIKARPIADHLFAACKEEFERLKTYLYVDSNSDISSPLVVAPKSTPPYVRFCGDYVKINKLLTCPQGPNVNVRDKIMKIKGYSFFGEFDMRNAFHQIKLAERTSNMLSVTTPWGCVRPKFLPEGVSPASIELQKIVDFIFGDMDHVVAIFDNLLVCGETLPLLYHRIEIFLDTCIKHNVILKLSKSNIGFTEVEFFGFKISKHVYKLTEERKKVINEIPFPRTATQMRSFLGACLFFHPFVPNYAQIAAPLNEMIKNGFSWDPSTWTADYEKTFNEVKEACQNSFELAFPDFSKKWIMRTDASKIGCGGVLLQEEVVDEEGVLRPVFFVSKKFSESAQNWSTIQQEAYGIYFTIYKLKDYLLGKYFEVETDHSNLQWIEASLNPAIVRMRIFMQSYTFLVRHIPGKLNIAADYLSRYHSDVIQDESTEAALLQQLTLLALTSTERHIAAWFDTLIGQSTNLLASLAVLTRSQARATDIELIRENPDQLSEEEERVDTSTPVDDTDDFSSLPPQELIQLVHNGKKGHWGAYRTWAILNDTFPGHNIPFRVIQDFVQQCPICQKFNQPMRQNKLSSQYRTIKSMVFRKALGIDHVSVTPISEGEYGGYKGITVIVNLFTGHAELYPYKESTATHDSICLHDYMSRYGRFDEIHTDPGTDFKSKILEQLNKWYGITHVFSLIDRHESNGAERVIKEVIRHLAALVNDERVVKRWAEPDYISSVRLLCNSTPLSERGGYSAHDLQFGIHDQPYFVYGFVKSKNSWSGIVKRIHESVAAVREASKDYQRDLAKKRGADVTDVNRYQIGDYVLAEKRTKMNSLKLLPRYLGPYEVLSQYKNDVKCRHMATSEVIEYHVEELQLFVGSKEEAEKASLLDSDLYYIDTILAHKGNPYHRTSMEFLIKWADGEIKFDRWNTNKDNFSKTSQFRRYIDTYPELRRLAYTHSEWSEKEAQANTSGTFYGMDKGTFYHDMESYGTVWYQGLDLPGVPEQRYYSQIKVIRQEANHLVVKDMDIPTRPDVDEEYWLRPADILNLANVSIPEKAKRISSDLVKSKNITRP